MYSSEPSSPPGHLGTADKQEVRDQLDLEPVHNEGAIVTVTTPNDRQQRALPANKTLTAALADGSLAVGEIVQLEFSDDEIRQILPRAAHYHYWTADNLDANHIASAAKNYPDVPVPRRYELEAYRANRTQARVILLFSDPGLQEYVVQLYGFTRVWNPVQFVGEKSVAVVTGYEPVLGIEVNRIQTAAEIVLYLAVIKGVNWATAKFQGMALAPANAPEASAGPLFTWGNGGRVQVVSGQRFSPAEIEAAFARGSAGESVTLGVLPRAPLDPTIFPVHPSSAKLGPWVREGEYVYVRDVQGVIHIAADGRHMHPRVLGGAKPATGAGTIVVDGNGTVVEITNISGTFQFPPSSIPSIRLGIESQGVKVSPGVRIIEHPGE